MSLYSEDVSYVLCFSVNHTLIIFQVPVYAIGEILHMQILIPFQLNPC